MGPPSQEEYYMGIFKCNLLRNFSKTWELEPVGIQVPLVSKCFLMTLGLGPVFLLKISLDDLKFGFEITEI